MLSEFKYIYRSALLKRATGITCAGGGAGRHMGLKNPRLMAARVQVPPRAPQFCPS